MTKGKYKRKRENAKKSKESQATGAVLDDRKIMSAEQTNVATGCANQSNGEKDPAKAMLRAYKWFNENISANAVIALFTVVLAVVGTWQLIVISVQLDDAREVQSARLVMEVAPIVKSGPSDTLLVDWNLKIGNVGGTVALDVSSSSWDVFEIVGTEGVYNEPPNAKGNETIPSPSSSGRTIAAGSDVPIPLQQQLTGWGEVQADKMIYVIHAHIAYKDIFNRPHLSSDCFYYDSWRERNFVRCPPIPTTRRENQ
jgi:hypothetical protein